MNIRHFAVSLIFLSAIPAFGQAKKTMAIDPFDYSAVMTAVQSIFGTQMDIGQGISAMMTKRVAQAGRFRVVERRKIEALTHEQDFDASNRVKQGTGARIGQIKGAQLELAGDIVVFGRDDRRVGGAVGGGTWGAAAGVGGHKTTDKAVVVLNFRLIDVETTEIVASGEARGESKRASKGFGAALWAGGVLAGGGFDMNSSNFGQTIIGEATMDACDKLAEQLNAANLEGGADARENDLDARVADVTGSTMTINAGTAAGLQPGQTFTVYHKGKEIKDPSTGEVLDVQTTPIGQFTVTVVRDRITVGNFSGQGQPAVGDVVRK